MITRIVSVQPVNSHKKEQQQNSGSEAKRKPAGSFKDMLTNMVARK